MSIRCVGKHVQTKTHRHTKTRTHARTHARTHTHTHAQREGAREKERERERAREKSKVSDLKGCRENALHLPHHHHKQANR